MIGFRKRRVLQFLTAVLLQVVVNQLSVAQQEIVASVNLHNPINANVEYFFRLDGAKFQFPGMTISSNSTEVLNFKSYDTVMTVMRVYDNANNYHDNIIGWFDFVRASKDPKNKNNQGKISFKPTVITKTKQVPQTSTKFGSITKTDGQGNQYTVQVPYSETKVISVQFSVTEIRATMTLPNNEEVDLQKYVSQTPK